MSQKNDSWFNADMTFDVIKYDILCHRRYYTLRRENIFPVDDFHLKQIMIKVYNLNENSKLKSQMLSISKNWKNKKSLAVLYLLEYKRILFS